jgi:hypothetical protein
MKKIALTQGKFALVDDEDFEKLSKFKWCANKIGGIYYAVRNDKRTKDGRKTISMHRVVMDSPEGMDTDHKDGDGLNNQKKNLRICTHAENLKNQKLHKNNISGLKGVSFYKRVKKWVAFIGVDGKQISLGYFDTKLEAYQAYCDACLKYHGKFSRLK